MSTTLKIGYLRLMKRIGKKSIIAKSVFGFPYRISLGDTFSENPFYNDSANVGEILSMLAWIRYKNGPIIYDVGGHCGFFATQLAQILRSFSPKVFSFEPVPPTFSDLVQSVQDLKLQEFVCPIAIALGEESSFLRLNYSKINSMLAQVVPINSESNKRSGNHIYIAPSSTLDEFIDQFAFPDVIKIDVEGWEVPVFRGMKSLFNSEKFDHVGICLEWNPGALNDVGFTLLDLYECLQGFKFYYINDYEGQKISELMEVNPLDINYVCNLFCFKETADFEKWRNNFLDLKNEFGVMI